MPAVDPKAVLEIEDVKRAMTIAAGTGPQEAALFAWMYEFGARASEPGLQLVGDVDLYNRRAMPVHLKKNAAYRGEVRSDDWHVLLPFCDAYVRAWIGTKRERDEVLFPSKRPGRCYVCQGTGKRAVLRRKKDGSRYEDKDRVFCHHCAGKGVRAGMDRFEAGGIVGEILTKTGVPKGRRHPHVLRHSIISHLLDGGMPATVVQDRVGHSMLATTLSYARATKAAAARMKEALGPLYEGWRP